MQISQITRALNKQIIQKSDFRQGKDFKKLLKSNFEAATEACVQFFDVLLGCGGLQSPLYELDPVGHPRHLTLDVGALYRHLHGRPEARLGLSERWRCEETKPLEGLRAGLVSLRAPLLLLVPLSPSLHQAVIILILSMLPRLQQVVVEISHFAVLEVKYIVNWLNDPIAKWLEVEEEFEKEKF